jgi:hypothetical protein
MTRQAEYKRSYGFAHLNCSLDAAIHQTILVVAIGMTVGITILMVVGMVQDGVTLVLLDGSSLAKSALQVAHFPGTCVGSLGDEHVVDFCRQSMASLDDCIILDSCTLSEKAHSFDFRHKEVDKTC